RRHRSADAPREGRHPPDRRPRERAEDAAAPDSRGAAWDPRLPTGSAGTVRWPDRTGPPSPTPPRWAVDGPPTPRTPRLRSRRRVPPVRRPGPVRGPRTAYATSGRPPATRNAAR